MKKVELIFRAILVPLDYLMLLLAGWVAYAIRFDEAVVGIRQVVYELPFKNYLVVLLISSLVMLIIFAWIGLYNITGTRRVVDELRKIIVACSTGVLIIIILFFFNRELFSSRFIILSTWGISILFVAVMRFAVIQVERALFRKGLGIHRVLLIGNNRTANALAEAIEGSPALGLQIAERTSRVDDDLFTKLPKVIHLKHIDEIISADPALTRLQQARFIEFSKVHHVDFKYAADIYDAQVTNISIRPIAGIPIVEMHRTALQGWGKIYKRVLDVIFSALAIIAFGPIMIITALAVRLDSTGPIIYKNQRVGENGRKIFVWKFRSMKQEYCITDENANNNEALELEKKLIAESSIKTGPVYKIKDDPRVTRVGSMIRRFSLDEFPQFFNVFLGHMSLVGPRPHQPREVEQYEDYQHAVLNIKPGITGLSQISGRSDLEFNEEIRLDTYYLENWSTLLDLYILFKTPFVLFKRRSAV